MEVYLESDMVVIKVERSAARIVGNALRFWFGWSTDREERKILHPLQKKVLALGDPPRKVA